MQFNIEVKGRNIPDKIKRKECLENISKSDTETLVLLNDLLLVPGAANAFKENADFLKTVI